jgi:hypothetical protein
MVLSRTDVSADSDDQNYCVHSFRDLNLKPSLLSVAPSPLRRSADVRRADVWRLCLLEMKRIIIISSLYRPVELSPSLHLVDGSSGACCTTNLSLRCFFVCSILPRSCHNFRLEHSEKRRVESGLELNERGREKITIHP